MLCEYQNDLDGRQIIHEMLAVALPEQLAEISEMLRATDEAFRSATVHVGSVFGAR